MGWQDLFLIIGSSASLTLLAMHDRVTQGLRTRVLYPVLLYDRRQRRILRRAGEQADEMPLPVPRHRRLAAARTKVFHTVFNAITCHRCLSFWMCLATTHVLHAEQAGVPWPPWELAYWTSWWPAVPLTILATWTVTFPTVDKIARIMLRDQAAPSTTAPAMTGGRAAPDQPLTGSASS